MSIFVVALSLSPTKLCAYSRIGCYYWKWLSLEGSPSMSTLATILALGDNELLVAISTREFGCFGELSGDSAWFPPKVRIAVGAGFPSVFFLFNAFLCHDISALLVCWSKIVVFIVDPIWKFPRGDWGKEKSTPDQRLICSKCLNKSSTLLLIWKEHQEKKKLQSSNMIGAILLPLFFFANFSSNI